VTAPKRGSWRGDSPGRRIAAGSGWAYSSAGTRLDDADKWGSVCGALVALLGLPMDGRRDSAGHAVSEGCTGEQSVTDSWSVVGWNWWRRASRGSVRNGADSCLHRL